MKRTVYNALRSYFKGQLEKHRANVNIHVEKAVGVAEHPDIMDTIEKELEIIADYHDKLSVLKKYFPVKNSARGVING